MVNKHLILIRLLLVLVVVCTLVTITTAPVSAQAVNSVTPTPATASATAGYTVNITTTVAIPVAGTITLTFPAGTTLPVTIHWTHVSVAGVVLAVTDPSPVVALQNVIITIPAAAAPLAAGTFNVVISQAAGITNPQIAATAASNTYIMSVSTSAEGAIGTLAYEILPAYAINPTSGSRITMVNVTGVGWMPASSVTIGGALSVVGIIASDGTFSLSSVPVASGSVTIQDGAGQTQAIPWVGTVTVPTFTLLPTVTVNPNNGTALSVVTIVGIDFTSGGNIPVGGITIGGAAWNPAPIALTTLDAYGINDDFQTMLVVPLTSPGAKTVQVTDSAAKQASSTFTVNPPSDTTPPAAVTDLAVIGGTATSLTLMWTAPGDDGNVGTASQYDIRYSTSAITAGNWGAATPCTGEPAPQVAGSSETFVVPGLSTVTTYHFALKTADEVPIWSQLSNVPSATTPTPEDTPEGENVEVSPIPEVVIVFSEVDESGWTTVFVSQVNPCADLTGFIFRGDFYDISTTATYEEGPVTVTLPFPQGTSFHVLVHSYWDGKRYRWKILRGTVSPDRTTITATVDTLSWYAVPQPEGGGGGEFCFIATAAYGSYLDGHVETLRNFRDQYLVTNPAGSALVSVYYKLSPPVAEFIDEHPALKPIMRVALLPAVGLSAVAVNTTLAEKMAIVGSLALASVLLAMWARKRQGKGSEYS